MALLLPPGITIDKFVGGYKSVSDFTDLADTETSDAQNVLYSPNADIDQRNGSLRLNPTKLADTPITGHYAFAKLGTTTTYNVVAIAGSLYNYNSSTASLILTSMSSTSETDHQFIQIQDPRSASDDIVVVANGVDRMRIWNGSGTAALLSAVTSATQVPIGKYMEQLKNRIYIANIVNTAQVDSPVQVFVSGFGDDGAPRPQRFADNFFVGGSDRSGQIQGIKELNDQMVIYREKDIWKFVPGSGNVLDTSSLFLAKSKVGLLAPKSLVDVGNFHIFLSELGVYAFDGNNLTHLSQKVDDEILRDSNQSRLKFAKAEFNKDKSHYTIYFPGSGQNRNTRGLTYDTRLGVWQPPITGRQVSTISNYNDSSGRERVVYGDYKGYLYEDDNGTNDGVATGFNGTVSAADASSITDSTAMFTTTNDGLTGVTITIIDGVGEGQSRIINSNTSAVISVEQDWDIIPDGTSIYSVGGIDAHWRSKDFDFTGHDILKIFRSLRARVREEGNFDLNLHYIIDFNKLARATKKAISLLGSGMVWGLSNWGSAIWGRKSTISKKISFRNTSTQSLSGQHMALRFSNRKANQSFKLQGFDVEVKAIGKR